MCNSEAEYVACFLIKIFLILQVVDALNSVDDILKVSDSIRNKENIEDFLDLTDASIIEVKNLIFCRLI